MKFDIAATLNRAAWSLVCGCLKFAMKRSTGDQDADALAVKTIGNGITIVDAAAGTARVEIDPVDTASLPAVGVNRIHWDLVGINGDDRRELARGHFRIEPDVVH